MLSIISVPPDLSATQTGGGGGGGGSRLGGGSTVGCFGHGNGRGRGSNQVSHQVSQEGGGGVGCFGRRVRSAANASDATRK
jgi:hypothetical protein